MGKRLLLIIYGLLLCLVAAVAAGNKRFTLVIDAGHGGHDAGAKGKISYEKNINLNVALAFGRYVERNLPEVKVIYTRRTDVFVPLHERANIANRNKADLFVSIHTNALPGGKISRGMETYTLGMHRAADNLDVAKRENSVILIEKDYKQHYEGFDPNSAESYILFEFLQDKNMAQSVDMARFVQRRTCASASRHDKGVKQAGFLVLRETSMPSCLIELGFITTPDEESFLNTQDGIDRLGRGIYQAFADYKQKYDKSITVPYKAPKEEVSVPKLIPDTPKPAPRKRAEQKKDEPTMAEQLAAARQQAQADTLPAKPIAEETPTDSLEKHEEESAAPIFKVQILTSNRRLRPGSQQFKGETDVDCYEENNLVKYTMGASANYNEIYQLRKRLVEKFPEAFIIAFKDGEKTNVTEAIKEYRRNKQNANK